MKEKQTKVEGELEEMERKHQQVSAPPSQSPTLLKCRESSGWQELTRLVMDG